MDRDGGVVVVEHGVERVLYVPTSMGRRVHAHTARYLLMLGARGSAKSTTLRWDVHMRCLAYPGFRALIVRNTFPALRRSHLVNIVAEMAALGGTFNKTENLGTYANGSKCWYGSCDDEATINSYLSSEFYLFGPDELVTIPLKTFMDLDACVRVPEGSGLLPLTRAASNTLGPHARWVKRWFVDKTVSAEESESYDPKDFAVVESRLEDNPYLQADSYRKSLGHHPEHVRRSWIYNEWVLEGNYFDDYHPTQINEATDDYEPWHVISELPTVKGAPLLDQRWISIYRAIDWGFSPDPAVCLWIAVLPNRRGIVVQARTWLKTPAAQVARDIVEDSDGMKIVDTFCDPTMFVSSKATEGLSVGDIFEASGVPLTPSVNDRRAIGDAIHEWLNTTIDGLPKIQLYGPGCPDLVRTFPDMQRDKTDPRKIADGEDHWVIALGYFCQSQIAASQPPDTSRVPRWMRHRPDHYVLGSESVRHARA